MPTFLLTWNPERFVEWDDLAETAAKTARGETYRGNWSSGNTKSIVEGDRLFLLKQGPEPKGIMGSGRAVSGCYEADHWDEAKAAAGRKSLFVEVEFDRILDPESEPILSPSVFTTGALSKVYWRPPASGFPISEEAGLELEAAWREHLQAISPSTQTHDPSGRKNRPPYTIPPLVTIYYRGDWGILKIEGFLRSQGPNYAATGLKLTGQNGPFALFTALGRKKQEVVWQPVPYSYLLILRGTGYPDPPSVYATDEDGKPRPPIGKMLDPRAVVELNKVINPLTEFFIADYRYNKSEDFTEEDLEWLGRIEPELFPPEAEGGFFEESQTDERSRRVASVVQRLGQEDFRRRLLEAYGSRCPVTGCRVPAALQAAHIVPYLGPKSNHVANGLPLRADIHNLFDLFLLSVDPDSMEIRVAPSLSTSEYGGLENKTLTLPVNASLGPSHEALRLHFRNFTEKNGISGLDRRVVEG
jgi:HNH endonuclease